ncbi:MAG: hypothetical protein ACRYGG_05095 [Janthinobacterium lividum]
MANKRTKSSKLSEKQSYALLQKKYNYALAHPKEFAHKPYAEFFMSVFKEVLANKPNFR